MAIRQINQRVGIFLFSMLMLFTLLPPAQVVSMACNACGPECANACGTAMFRACCFNYNRKRSIPSMDSEFPVPDNSANLSDGLRFDLLSDNEISSLKLQRPNLSSRWLNLVEKLSGGTLTSERKQQYIRDIY
ncbi:uncharacterized protein [Parasteatoda tepidariorum]|uniref:uncharacterized protein n=1 Tax=Parasteatoda tepidariorum TaxID=114398 RepID=UPI001C7239D7|nr:uncharacterized protein LOC107457477 [Parasteatoda tepidariorum]